MDFFDDDDDEPPIAPPVLKFKPKAKPKARAAPSKKAPSAAQSSTPHQAADTQHVISPTKAVIPHDDVSDGGFTSNVGANVDNLTTIAGHLEENATSEDCGNRCDNTGGSMLENAEASVRLDCVDDTVLQSTSVAEDLTNSLTLVEKNQLSSKDTVASSNAGYTQMNSGLLETEGGHAFTSSEPIDVVVESASDPQGSAYGGPDFLDGDALSGETECMLNQDELFETSPDLTSHTFAATGCPLNQASQYPQSPDFVAEAYDSVHVNDAENNIGQNEEEGQPKKRKSSSRSNKDDNGTRKYTRKSKKAVKGLEIPNEGTTNANEETTEPNQETTETSEKTNEDAIGTRKAPRKRKTKQAAEKSNEETTEALENPDKQPPKKFPRSSRRRNRRLDTSLLETPEDEIDYLSLPIKDLILLAEHRERQLALENKTDTSQQAMPVEEATVPEEPVKKTNDNVWGDFDDDDYDDMDGPAHVTGSFGDPSYSASAKDTTCFNYHSRMNRTARVKWTKQDTVLFYEGVRQFGSDLSMIQHLFPGRTRQQIKLKYKKEERQKPMELLDALANGAKDLTHYKLVIGRLQEKIDREEEQMPEEEEEEEGTLGANGNEEGNPEEGTADDTQEHAQDESAKFEQNGDVEDPAEERVGSPVESDESDIDWGEYKSTF